MLDFKFNGRGWNPGAACRRYKGDRASSSSATSNTTSTSTDIGAAGGDESTNLSNSTVTTTTDNSYRDDSTVTTTVTDQSDRSVDNSYRDNSTVTTTVTDNSDRRVDNSYRDQSTVNITTTDNSVSMDAEVAKASIRAAQEAAAATAAAQARATAAIESSLRASLGANQEVSIAAIRGSNASLSESLSFADTLNRRMVDANGAVLDFADASQARAFEMAGTTQRDAYGFAKGAMQMTADSYDKVLELTANAMEQAAEETAATRDYTLDFVRDFYRTQEDGDTKFSQDLMKYGAAVLVAAFAAWALSKSKS